MDLTLVGSVLGALLVALPAVSVYFQRQTRLVRRQNRKLRALVQEQDVWLYRLEREGWTSRGMRPPERPTMLRPADDDDEDDDRIAPPPAGDGQRDRGAPRRASRHRATER